MARTVGGTLNDRGLHFEIDILPPDAFDALGEIYEAAESLTETMGFSKVDPDSYQTDQQMVAGVFNNLQMRLEGTKAMSQKQWDFAAKEEAEEMMGTRESSGPVYSMVGPNDLQLEAVKNYAHVIAENMPTVLAGWEINSGLEKAEGGHHPYYYNAMILGVNTPREGRPFIDEI